MKANWRMFRLVQSPTRAIEDQSRESAACIGITVGPPLLARWKASCEEFASNIAWLTFPRGHDGPQLRRSPSCGNLRTNLKHSCAAIGRSIYNSQALPLLTQN